MGDFNQGTRHYRARFTEDDVRQIRELCKEHTIRAIAKRYDVSHHAIYKIANFKTWKHVR